jgi:hypothetical protein
MQLPWRFREYLPPSYAVLETRIDPLFERLLLTIKHSPPTKISEPLLTTLDSYLRTASCPAGIAGVLSIQPPGLALFHISIRQQYGRDSFRFDQHLTLSSIYTKGNDNFSSGALLIYWNVHRFVYTPLQGTIE